MTPTNRRPAGTPTGGQFAPCSRPEAAGGTDSIVATESESNAMKKLTQPQRTVCEYLNGAGWASPKLVASRLYGSSSPAKVASAERVLENLEAAGLVRSAPIPYVRRNWGGTQRWELTDAGRSAIGAGGPNEPGGAVPASERGERPT